MQTNKGADSKGNLQNWTSVPYYSKANSIHEIKSHQTIQMKYIIFHPE